VSSFAFVIKLHKGRYFVKLNTCQIWKGVYHKQRFTVHVNQNPFLQLHTLHVTASSFSLKLTWVTRGACTTGRQRRGGIRADVATVSPLCCRWWSLLVCTGCICDVLLRPLWAAVCLCTAITHDSLAAAQTRRTSWRIAVFWADVSRVSRHPVTHIKQATMRDTRFVEQRCWYFQSFRVWCCVTGGVQ
jgi:hypothetical protein